MAISPVLARYLHLTVYLHRIIRDSRRSEVRISDRVRDGVTPGVVLATFQSRPARPFRRKPRIAGPFTHKAPCST
jgi:hypothetical protein